MKKIKKSLWSAYWKLHDKKKMLISFAALALYTFGKAVYDIGRNDGSRMEIDHAGQVELSVKPDNNHNVIPYLYGTDEE